LAISKPIPRLEPVTRATCCFISRTMFSRHNIIVKDIIIEQASAQAIII
jgi:hypothetical protein